MPTSSPSTIIYTCGSAGGQAFLIDGDGEILHRYGSGDLGLPSLSGAGDGITDPRRGDGSLALPSATGSGTGMLHRMGSGALSLEAFIVEADGGEGVTTRFGDMALMLEAITVSNVGHTLRQGTGDLALGHFGAGFFTAEGEGEVDNNVGNLVLPELTLTGVGLIPRVGSGDAALPGITTGTFGAFASGGATAVIGAGSLRLPGLAAAGVGDADVEETPGTGDLVFADMALNGSGVAFDDERDADPIDLSFPGLVLTSLGAVANPPNADPALVLPVLEVAADGTVSPNRAGDGPLALPGLELAADGEVETPATAEGELDLPGLTTASVALAGISPEATDQDLPLPALLASGLGAFVPLPTAEDENLILPALTAGGFGISRTFDFDVYGRRPISVDQWHGAQNYPFVEAQPDAVVGDLVADAFLLLPAEESCSFPYPYQIAWMSGFGTAMIARPEGVPVPTHPYDVGITDSEDNVVFDSTLAGTTYKSAPWGNRLLVSEWLQEDRVLRIVHHIAWENDEDVVEYPLYIVPTGSTVLDIRTIHFQPNRPAEILVGGTILVGSLFDEIVLDAGYNVLLEVGETVISASGRRATTVTVHGDPGEGEGFFGGCNEEGASEDRPVYSLGGATADEHGNLFLTGDDCYRVTQSQLHELLVEMNCRPCCSCDDHVAVYRAIKNDWDTARDLGAQAMEIRDEFQEAITTWNAQVACAENEQLRAILIPWNGGSASIAAAYCHSKNVCLPTVVMRFEFVLSGTDEPMDDTDVELVANSIMIEGTDIDPELVTLSGFWPNYSYTFTNVDAMSAIQARFQVKFDRAKLGGSASLDLTVRVGLTNKTVSKALI